MNLTKIYRDWLEKCDKAYPNTCSVEELMASIESAFKNFQSRSITWSVDDFEQRARQIEENEADPTCDFPFDDKSFLVPDHLQLFDRTSFSTYVQEMVHRNDNEYGITWVDVTFYLETYCKIKKP